MRYGALIFAGVLLALMQSCNGMLSSYVGVIGTSFMVHLIGGVVLGGYLLVRSSDELRLRGLPWPWYSAGALGVALVAMISFCMTKLGPGLVICLSIGGQITASILCDAVGWPGGRRIPFRLRRLPGLALMGIGIWFVYQA